MSSLTLQAEHLKLARLLGCPESVIAGLAGLDVAALRQLRGACTSMLFDGDRATLQRVAGAARILPGALNALLAEKAMGPVLASRVAGLMPPKDGVEIATRVALSFNVEVTLLLDPRSAAPMLRLMPMDLVVAVTRELVKRREFIVMARFVDTLTDEQIRGCMAVIDDESMLRIGFFVESPQRLAEVVSLMNDARLQKVVAIAGRPELALGGAVMVLLSGVEAPLRVRIVQAAMTHADESVGEQLVIAAREHGMQALLTDLVASLPAVASQRLARLMA
ncbi:hypothetical protein DFR24_1912 [Panacagrimonas perspica]|uniref:Uncharacterized protein n=1 Tax=Panacagrimonas perspica TaxID=381431 RepID=A0A4S3KC06_9GAMM|nr:hypothetical protein [Panacagrimonas perspica]TDU32514.1 hypothetical protein DFR24_1912 [Panacagrimonas perspica]THD05424.1 hypothetical protein B1810_01440 [Panacagrimonas perspica]